eukprot:3822219-Pyramimonas_sp.AAC.1
MARGKGAYFCSGDLWREGRGHILSPGGGQGTDMRIMREGRTKGGSVLDGRGGRCCTATLYTGLYCHTGLLVSVQFNVLCCAALYCDCTVTVLYIEAPYRVGG